MTSMCTNMQVQPKKKIFTRWLQLQRMHTRKYSCIKHVHTTCLHIHNCTHGMTYIREPQSGKNVVRMPTWKHTYAHVYIHTYTNWWAGSSSHRQPDRNRKLASRRCFEASNQQRGVSIPAIITTTRVMGRIIQMYELHRLSYCHVTFVKLLSRHGWHVSTCVSCVSRCC